MQTTKIAVSTRPMPALWQNPNDHLHSVQFESVILKFPPRSWAIYLRLAAIAAASAAVD
jgi:hypothetical protein